MPFVIKSAVDTYLSDKDKCLESYTDDPAKAQRFRFYLEAKELAFDSERVVCVEFEEGEE